MEYCRPSGLARGTCVSDMKLPELVLVFFSAGPLATGSRDDTLLVPSRRNNTHAHLPHMYYSWQYRLLLLGGQDITQVLS